MEVEGILGGWTPILDLGAGWLPQITYLTMAIIPLPSLPFLTSPPYH